MYERSRMSSYCILYQWNSEVVRNYQLAAREAPIDRKTGRKAELSLAPALLVDVLTLALVLLYNYWWLVAGISSVQYLFLYPNRQEMPLYQAHHATLTDLLSTSSQEANVLIPNLQRPYVWNPDQVIRLVDSLLRGWPFSTLLLWNLGAVNQKDTLIPSRPFWRLIDRTYENKAEQFGAAEKPNEFKMVLDGQQRLQSLLLVFGSEASGLRLLDADWKISLTGSSNLRGIFAKKRWTVGRVYLDLHKLRENLTESKFGQPNLRPDADFTQILVWAFNGTDPMSRYVATTDSTYLSPLPDVSLHSGRYISMAKIWKHSIGLGSRDPDSQYGSSLTLLEQHEVEDPRSLLNGFVQFSLKISQAQTQNVNFLELGTLASSGYTLQHEYNDAIVNIFTRLNSGGRTLTREEITFAWIKVSWDHKPLSAFGSAESAIAKLSEICSDADPELKLASDEVVKMLSFIWSIFGTDRKGALVKDRDLLDGDTVRSMANWLYQEMDAIRAAFEKVLTVLGEQGIRYGEVYRSTNALAVLLACATGHELLRKKLQVSTTDGIGADLAVTTFLESTSEAWLVLSQWADEWAKGTDETMARYAKVIAEKWTSLDGAATLASAQLSWSTVLESSFVELRLKSLSYIQKLEIEERGQVRIYRLPLWVWNRLNPVRSKHSGILLRDSAKGKISVEVDHVISWSYWEARFNGNSDQLKVANQIGNCALLEKTFNISKGKNSLDVWLNKVNDFPGQSWKDALAIPNVMSSLIAQEEILESELTRVINERTAQIKDELRTYIIAAGALEN